ncbi:sulfate adenylyltransferase [Tupanvirus soda lake]|uniref:adenylyl-sulfate kinase n=2 Tax=Tupanvirus TaxID=2094720 RepID=A0A6N1P299_9VIRU|nr:sulfate adenylyltransferase [Tupanvirus soda lake]QKU35151.1 sulfate adenylyltransferase [Tupanvirus soda lake]
MKLVKLLATKPIISLDENNSISNEEFQNIHNNYPFITLNSRQLCDYEMIHNGGFYPLTGFMTESEYDSCVKKMELPNGNIWPIPITLHVSEKWLMDNLIDRHKIQKYNYTINDIIKSKNFKECLLSSYTILKDETGIALAIMKNESIFKPDLYSEAENVFNAITDNVIDTNHPYVNILKGYETDGLTYCIGGQFIFSKNVLRYDFKEYRLTPRDLKQKFIDLEWCDKEGNAKYNIIGFQTRNPMHKSHFQLTKFALREATHINNKPSKLLLHPVVGVTQDCDIDYHTRVKCYKKLINNYENSEAILSLLPLSMRMAGPREAVWHAIIRKNYGVTHFVVGRDHAGPSYNRINGKKFYGPYDAQNLLIKYADKIGINVITSQMIVFSMERNKAYQMYSEIYNKSISDINDNDITQLEFMCKLNENDGIYKSMEHIDTKKELFFEISGTQQRKLLRENKPIPNWFSYPQIINILRNEFELDKGIVFYFVGLSGSGKTTIACNLVSILKEMTFKKITYLDGDVVRLNLSKGLGFSKEDRSTNIRRIGYVASEIAKHGGICVVANIAPFLDDRTHNKKLIEANGGIYIEIYVDTPVEICAKRDVKGLYKLANEGKIKLTGINDPFEIPCAPNIHINGTQDLNTIINNLTNYIKDNQLFKN